MNYDVSGSLLLRMFTHSFDDNSLLMNYQLIAGVQYHVSVYFPGDYVIYIVFLVYGGQKRILNLNFWIWVYIYIYSNGTPDIFITRLNCGSFPIIKQGIHDKLTLICQFHYCLPYHDDVIKWDHFPRYWPFVRGNHRSRWIPHTMASVAELWCFLWSASEYTIE